MLTEFQNHGMTEWQTCWKQYTPLKLHVAWGVMKIIMFKKTNEQYQLDVIHCHYLYKKSSMSKIKYEEVRGVKR